MSRGQYVSRLLTLFTTLPLYSLSYRLSNYDLSIEDVSTRQWSSEHSFSSHRQSIGDWRKR